MSAKDELRRMLTESGVEWDYGITGTASTMFNANGVELTFIDMRDGVTCSTILTPAQAIAATVGRGTCEADETETIKCWVKCKDEPNTEHMELIHVMECSECGHTYEHVNGDYEFCPRCGKKRVDA